MLHFKWAAEISSTLFYN